MTNFVTVATDTGFPLWARLSTLEKGAPIWVPLKTHTHFEQRRGTRSLSVQINDSPAGLRFGVLTDVSAALAESRAAYVPGTDAIALDLGLRTLFATDQGDLLGQGWMDRLQRIDARLQRLAAHRQRMLPAEARRQHGRGRRVASPRYRGYVVTVCRPHLESVFADKEHRVHVEIGWTRAHYC